MSARLVPAALGAVAVAVVVLVVLALTGGGDNYTVRAEVSDAAGLRKNSDVKIGGVPGGRVTSIKLTRDDRALITMRLDKNAAPIGAGAAAHIRPVNLLGEKYVDLDAGDLRHPVPSGTQIPSSRTGSAVELDDVLNTLTPDTRGALRILINEAGIAMAGRGSDFNGLLDQLPPALDRIDALLTQVGDENDNMRRLITQGDRVVGSLANGRTDLAGLVDTAGAALKATADHRRELAATVAAAPDAIGQLTTSLEDLDRTAADLRPAARGLRASAAPLARTLQALPGFVSAAQPTLKTARAVAPSLTRLGVSGTPTLRRLRPTSDRLATFAKRLAPVTDAFDRKGAFDALLGLADGWAKTIQTSDGLGHVFRLRVEFDKQLATHILQKYGILGAATRKGHRGTKKIVLPKLRLPDAAKRTADAVRHPRLPDVAPTVEKLGRTVTGVVGALTGRAPQAPPAGKSTTALLDYLLGSR